MSVTSGGASTLTYDLNGNMTGDGTNSYSWDACNRLIEIVYPGTGNNSQFVYDGLGRNVSILEYSGGSLTSTKQFVWTSRGYAPMEARNASGTITAQYFPFGETISGTSYFYTRDQQGSIKEMTNSSGVIEAQYSYDPFGQVTKISESVASDFQYAGYYLHATSGLLLTLTRAYSSKLGRFINRDRFGERGGINLYGYVNNEPILRRDPRGLDAPQPQPAPTPTEPGPNPNEPGPSVPPNDGAPPWLPPIPQPPWWPFPWWPFPQPTPPPPPPPLPPPCPDKPCPPKDDDPQNTSWYNCHAYCLEHCDHDNRERLKDCFQYCQDKWHHPGGGY